VRDPFLAECDVCVMIGQHAMAGIAQSNQNHTQKAVRSTNTSSMDAMSVRSPSLGYTMARSGCRSFSSAVRMRLAARPKSSFRRS
jgi:hypothetical protein